MDPVDPDPDSDPDPQHWLLQIFVYIFSIYLCIVYEPIFFGAIVLTLGLRLLL